MIDNQLVRLLKERQLIFILMRHAHYSTKGMENPLDKKGKRQSRKKGKKIWSYLPLEYRQNGIILTSETKRSHKTGKIVAGTLRMYLLVEDCFLGSEDVPGAMSIIKSVLRIQRLDYIVIVGHEPFLLRFSKDYLDYRAEEWPMAEFRIWDFSAG